VIPKDARARFRDGLVTPTSGWCDGYTQANLISVPRDLAWDFLLFAQRNPKPCPVLDVIDAGEVAGPLAEGDIRTDVPRYRVWVDGELVAEPTDVRDVWRPDLVSFLIGCSFTFEYGLWATRVVQTRSDLLDASRILEEASLDKYVFQRDAYLQRRRNLIYDGRPPRERDVDTIPPGESK